ncbi:phage tail tape measure protein [Pasteurellaceae bacterium Orientalotternb1]|nr:phage tail tape measure protein [Pasteurellaceae bacterium Orientalotternb1]
MRKAQQVIKRYSEESRRYLKNIDDAMTNMNASSKMTNRLLFLTQAGNIGQLAQGVLRYADSYTELGNRMRLVTDNNVELARATQSVFDISLKTNQAVDATSQVYQRFAQNADTLGISQKKVAELTETVSKAVAISGASSASAQAALTQFGQSLASGVFRGQEFNSVMEQTPGLAQAIAKGLGVTTGELRQMANDGRLTSDVLVKALEKAKSSVDSQFNNRVVTLSQSFTNLQTQTTKFVGELNNSVGITKAAAQAVESLANNLDKVAVVGLAGLGGVLGQKAYNGLNESRQRIANNLKELKSVEDLTQAVYRQSVVEANLAKQELIFAQVAKDKIANEISLNRAYQATATTNTQLAVIKKNVTQLTQAEKAATDALTAAQLRYKQAKDAATQSYAQYNVAQKAATTEAANLAKSSNLLSVAARGAATQIKAFGASLAANPIFLVTTIGAGIWQWYENIQAAKQKAIEFANELPAIRDRLEEMSAIELKATFAKTEESIFEQKKRIAEMEREYAKLEKRLQSLREEHGKTIYSVGENGETISHIADKTKAIEAVTRQLAIAKYDLKKANEKLTDSEKTAIDTMNKVPVAELRDRFLELFPSIEQSKIKVDGLNVSIGDFTLKLPSATAEALKFSGAVGGIAQSAINAALAILQMNGAIAGNTKLDAHITDNEKLIAVYKARAAGNQELANQLQSEINATQKAKNLDIDLNTDAGKAEFERLKRSEFALLEAQGNAKGGGKGKTPKSDDFQKQFGEMSYRLSELKANAKDIEIFGQVSQYQEVKKLMEDIALNAEKYKNFGIEGVEQLKALAAQIDSENQKLEIAKFGYDNTQKIKAMEFELTLLGKTRSEQELLQYGYQLEQEAAKLRIGMTEENIAKLDEEMAKLKERYAEYQRHKAQAEEMQRNDPFAGMRDGLNRFGDDATNIFANVSDITYSALNGMSDALTDFVMTGKADFRSMAQSILKDISNMIVKMLIFNAIKSSASALGFGGFAEGGFVGGGNFAVGGYTGDGGKYTPAGIVHKGEYVITKEATSRIGLDYLNYLNYGKRGFASGGGVDVPRVPTVNHSFANGGETTNHVSISVHIDKDGNTNTSVEQQAQQGKQLGNLIQAKVLEVLAKERRVGGMLAR